MMRVLKVTDSEPQEKLPWSVRRARNFLLPLSRHKMLRTGTWCSYPRVRTTWIRGSPSLVMAAGRPSSNLRFMRIGARRAPVARRLWKLSREIPLLRRKHDSRQGAPCPALQLAYMISNTYMMASSEEKGRANASRQASW